MIQLAFFTLFMLFSVATLIIVPIALHPTLPSKRKWVLGILSFVVIVPLSIALYLWLGVPQMAAVS